MELPIVAGVEFRQVVGFRGYAVGDDGSVWSCHIAGGRGGLGGKWKRLRHCVLASGYAMVVLRRDRESFDSMVHRLVLTAFAGPGNTADECRHKDGNRLNNRLSNLVWGTKAQNFSDREQHGTHPRGEVNGRSLLTESDVAEIKLLYATGKWTQQRLADKFGVHFSTVSKIVRGINWSHVNLEARKSK